MTMATCSFCDTYTRCRLVVVDEDGMGWACQACPSLARGWPTPR